MIKHLIVAVVAGAVPVVAVAGPVFGAASYVSTLTLASGSTDIGMGVAFANNTYFTAYGDSGKSPFAELDSSGNLISSVRPYPGIDFRSVFSNAAGEIFVRGYNFNEIWQQGVTFGTFTELVQLAGVIGANIQVVLDSSGTHYIGNNGGVLQFWNLAGIKTKTVTLAPGAANGVISVFGNYALSYNQQGLHAYDLNSGALIDTTQLNGATPGQYGVNYGQSFANGYFFVANGDGSFSGFQIGQSGGAVPEPATWALMIAGFGLVGTAARRRRSVTLA